ncbi:MAG: glutamate--tRNA ligase family protein [Bdellovibrionota bacterium]
MSGVRFAPSPTGAFHLGNFRTAWISHAWAKHLGQPWIVRFEDIDAPRVVQGAQDRQLAEMRELGLNPDETRIQSASYGRYLSLFEAAREAKRIYPCLCSRKEVQENLAAMASAPHGEAPVYDGHCRDLKAWPKTSPAGIAWRFRREDPTQDFVIGRTERDGSGFTPAYHWACAIDDFDGEYLLLVRAWDLSGVVPQQRAIQEWVARHTGRGYRPQAVFHCALVTADDGSRLEKRTRGITLPEILARGISPERLAQALEQSFHPHWEEFAEGRVFGEQERSLSLFQLTLDQ